MEAKSHSSAIARTLAGCGLLVALLVSSRAHATPPCAVLGSKCPQPMNDETSRGLALGTGARASALSTSALAYNPAALALGRLYHIEGLVDYIPQAHAVALGGAVVDSSTSKIGAGIGLRGFLSGSEGLGGIDGRLGLAVPFSDAVSLGLSGRYINLTNTTVVPGKSVTTKVVHGFTMDASFRVQPVQMLQFSLATLNFVDLGSAYAPLYLVPSVAFALGQLVSVGADVLIDTTSYKKLTYTAGGGIELLAANTIPLRIGYAADLERSIQSLSAGIGYTDKTVGFDLSLQQQVSGGDATRVIGALRYYVH